MSREVMIDIPENVPIEYELAGLGSRFGAIAIDLGWKLMAMIIGSLLFFGVVALTAITWSRFSKTLMGYETALLIIYSFIVMWGYNIFFEIKWNGQTPGKRTLGLQVIRMGGYPVDVQSVYIRNLLSLIDFLPAFYFAGVVSIFRSDEYQRIGDRVAGTLVIKQRPNVTLDEMLQPARILPEHLNSAALELVRLHASLLTPEEYRAVKHFTERRSRLTYEAQRSAAKMLGEPLMARLGITPPNGTVMIDYANLLEYLAVAYEQLKRPLSLA